MRSDCNSLDPKRHNQYGDLSGPGWLATVSRSPGVITATYDKKAVICFTTHLGALIFVSEEQGSEISESKAQSLFQRGALAECATNRAGVFLNYLPISYSTLVNSVLTRVVYFV